MRFLCCVIACRIGSAPPRDDRFLSCSYYSHRISIIICLPCFLPPLLLYSTSFHSTLPFHTMNRNYRGGRGGGSATTATTTTTTTHTQQQTLKPMMKAKHADNQEALDRLLEIAQNCGQSNYFYTVRKAMHSVRDCKHPLTTIAQAMELKFVGDRLSRVIVPNEARSNQSASSTAATAPTPAPAARSSSTSSNVTANANPNAGPERPKTKRSRQTTLTSATTTSCTSASNSAAAAAAAIPPPSAKEQAYERAKQEAEDLVLPKGPWKVILLVDIREHRSQNVVSKCQQSGIPCEERSLPIGDMAWIAQCHDTTTGTIVEVLVGTILERKEVNDLAGSLFGTRFLEQRLRLFHCGVPQILYLVEGDLGSVVNCPAETLRMAMMETRVQLGFSVLQTKHLEDTVRVLKGLHRRIVQRAFPNTTDMDELPTFCGRNSGPREDYYQRRRTKRRRPSSLLEMVFQTPPVPSFSRPRFTTYAELKAKVEWDREAGTKTVGAIYQAMLKQVPTLSQTKCQAISAVYPTWHHLLHAYDEASAVAQSTTDDDDIDDDIDNDRPKTAATATATATTKTPLLVKDVPSGRQKVGPKSAAELDWTCCVQGDGTIMTRTATSAKITATTKATATATRTTVPYSNGASSTFQSTSRSASNDRPGSVAATSTTAIRMSSTTTTNVITSRLSAASNRGQAACLDLTHDSPAPNKQKKPAPVARHPPAAATALFSTSYEPLWCDDDSDSDPINKNDYGTGKTVGVGPSAIATTAITDTKKRSPASLDLSMSSSDDEDGMSLSLWDEKENKRHSSSAVARHTSGKLDSKPPAVASAAAAAARNLRAVTLDIDDSDNDDDNDDRRGNTTTTTAATNLPRDSYGDSTVWFSSPSTTASGMGFSKESKSTRSEQKLKQAARPNHQDISIVVIDSSDEDDDADADADDNGGGKARPQSSSSATTSFLQSSQESNSSSVGTPVDLRSRLAKRMGRETIEID